VSFNIENSLIENIERIDDQLKISTSNDKIQINLSDIFNVEISELDEENPTGLFVTLGSIAGLAMGDLTGAVGGGFGGWIASKFFGKKRIFFITFILSDQKISFSTNDENSDYFYGLIKSHINDFTRENFKNNFELSKSWPVNFKNHINNKKYIAFSDIFSGINIEKHETYKNFLEYNNGIIDEDNIFLIKKYFLKFKKIDLLRKQHNQEFIKANLNNINLKGLIPSQKKAVLTDDDSTLINAGAGSGKTKTILHKLAYLIDNNLCKPDEVLVLAYNRNVKEELIERIKSFNNKKINKQLSEIAEKNVHTFHGYGVKQLRNKKIAEFNEKVSDFESELRIKKGREIDAIINELYEEKDFRDNLLTYFAEYFFTYKDYFSDIENYDDYVKYIRNIGQITLSGIPMRSYEEVEIANYLYLNGIKFEYEKEFDGEYLYKSDKADFEIKDKNHLKNKNDKKYHPDFYLTDYKIYLEHFALNKNNEAPPFFKNPKGYYDQYLEKLNVHKNNNTKLITTFSWEKSEGKLLKNLEKKLLKNNVKFKKLKDTEVLEVFKSSGKLSRFTELVHTFMSHYKSNELDENKVKNKILGIIGDNNKRRCLIFLKLFIKIFEKYQQDLNKDNSIDFDDMIIEGRKELTSQGLKYIIVDEFQDISQARAKLLRKIKEINNAKLYCVGDDWQAINKFSGGDVTIFTQDFNKKFGHFERVDVDTTFRYGNLINNISSKFIQKNPSQLNKVVTPLRDIKGSSINIYETNVFSETMNKIIKKYKNVYILGRYNLDKYDNTLRKRLFKSNITTKYEINKFVRNKSLDVTYKTIHSAKGLEADVVCIINMFPGRFGFPSQMEDDEILALVLPNPETYPNAEERRLMYVAMTRARKEVHIFSGYGFYSSDFVKELKNDFNLDNKNKGNSKQSSNKMCPTHKVKLVRRNSYRGPFYGCPKFFSSEKCKYTEDAN
jgi:DNA helicase-4